MQASLGHSKVAKLRMSTLMKPAWILLGCLFLASAVFVLWYAVAANYGDPVAQGVYFLDHGNQTSTLVLRADHVFEQELRERGKLKRATGTWRRIGEGSITFSNEFLTVSGQERSTDGTAVADMRKSFGIFLSLEFRQYQVLWYERIDTPIDDLVSGTYTADGTWGSARLIMKTDHSFEQTIHSGGLIRLAAGNWSADQSGNVVFSKDFLKYSGEALTSDETAAALNPKGFVLQTAVTSNSDPPTFHKKQLF